ncbi:MAG TPA: amino acid adenylation domain-containing protein [Ktedonobacteraceae bacterium]|nr:amino acid adenylation domain-containing protein [Ktedonobacteraceae bacterium]
MSDQSEKKSLLSSEQRSFFEQLLKEEGIQLIDEPASTDADEPVASFIQERLWFMDKLAPGSGFYNTVEVLLLDGPLNIALLEESTGEVVRRHNVLRTSFTEVDGRPVPIVAEAIKFSIPLIDFRDFPQEQREDIAKQVANEVVEAPFDLSRGPLLRVMLLQIDDSKYISAMAAHHAILDGWSWGIMTEEIVAYYNATLNHQPGRLPDLPLQYMDFARSQREKLQGENFEQLRDYWVKQLEGSPLRLDLPTDHPRPAIQAFHGNKYEFIIPRALTDRINALCKREEVTQFVTLLAAYKVLLYRYSGLDDVLIGFSTWGRTRSVLEGIIGCFVNTLVLRTSLAGNPTFHTLLSRVQSVLLGAIAHQDMPFEKVIQAIQPGRDVSHNQLMQVMIGSVMVNSLSTPSLVDVHVQNISPDTNTVTCDLEIYVYEKPEGVQVIFEYSVDLFDHATIVQLARHYQRILEEVVTNPDLPIAMIPLLTQKEQAAILQSGTSQTMPLPQEQLITDLVTVHAQTRPEATALLFGDQSLSYAELNARVNQCAHYLQKLGVGPEVCVGLSLERSPSLIISMLGILKAGGAFVSLDPHLPRERLAFILKDARISYIMSDERWLQSWDELYEGTIVNLEAEQDAFQREATDEPVRRAHPYNLAYIAYTSGSTGVPKGVSGIHAGVINYLKAIANTYQLSADDVTLQLASLSFDASLRDILGPLSTGGQVVVVDEARAKDSSELLSLIARHQITTILSIVPSFCKMLVSEAQRQHYNTHSLRLLLSSGEALSWETVAGLQTALGEQLRIVNQYGPTECTLTSTFYPVPAQRDEWKIVPLGKPLAHYHLYVLDQQQQLTPVGVAGEICIGGVGITRGYHNSPALTAERFIPDIFCAEPGARLYRTGDLGRYLSDGTLQFLGRIDQQVKVRGIRVELEEIETILNQHPLVKRAIVLAQESRQGDILLFAYILVDSASEKDAPEGENILRQYMRERLPDYMVPTYFLTIDAIPFLPNHKVNIRALKALGQNLLEDKHNAESSEERLSLTPLQRLLSNVCAQLLGREHVGLHEDFFEIGGHSLLAMQAVAQLREIFQVDLPLISIFEEPTLAGLSQELEILAEEAGVDIQQIAEVMLQVEDLSADEMQVLLEDTANEE